MVRAYFSFGFRTVICGALGLLLTLAGRSFGDTPVQPVNARPVNARPDSSNAETGIASYYSDKFQGRQTASGELFDMHQLTAAHPTCKFGTRVKVTHLGNNRSVIVRINDRGPFIKGRVIDLSLAAARELQMVASGLAQVRVEIMDENPDRGHH